jgi:glutathione synthase/RimK-type ligase-like ATP-grasp enzyme
MTIMPRYIFRLGNITFSRDFINTLKGEGVIISRRNSFGRSAVLINHGNQKPIEVMNKVKSFYIINQPHAIKHSSNKRLTQRILGHYCPSTYNSPSEVNNFPVVIKPIHGFQGRGVRRVDSRRELRSNLRHYNDYIIQDYIEPKAEYRFNVLDNDIYQISRKEMVEGWNGKFDFEWVSLGENAKLSNEFYRFVEHIIEDVYNQLGSDLGSYAIDVIKGNDNDYYLSEINSAFGIGEFTMPRMIEILNKKYYKGDLEKYKVV